MIFRGYIYILLSIDYRGLKGYLIGLSKLVSFKAAICITNEEIHDNAKFGELIEQSVENVKKKKDKRWYSEIPYSFCYKKKMWRIC